MVLVLFGFFFSLIKKGYQYPPSVSKSRAPPRVGLPPEPNTLLRAGQSAHVRFETHHSPSCLSPCGRLGTRERHSVFRARSR